MALEVAGTHSPKLQHETCTHEVTFLSPPKYLRKASADSILTGRRKLPKSPTRDSTLFDFSISRPEFEVQNSSDSSSSLGLGTPKPVFTFNEIELDLEARPRDRRISILKLEESDIPTDPPGCLRKTNSLSEFQDHPELQQFILPELDTVSLATPRYVCPEDPSTPRGLSPSSSFEAIRRVQTFNDRQDRPTMELRRISTINLPPTETCSIEFNLAPDITIGSCLSIDGLGKSLDSDIWQETVSQEVVSSLSEREKNRQSAIHELIWTEQNHLFTLRVMLKIFAKRLKEVLHISDSSLEVLFPKIEDMLSLSEKFLMRLLNLRSEDKKLEFIGSTISDFFCGECRDSIKACYGHFIRKQTIALIGYKEMLKSRQFSIFIQKCGSMAECRRKTLPDCYLLISQRLTKYISLMERIYKYTDKDHRDYECLQDAIEEVREIVQSINDELTEEQNRDFLNKITANYDNAIIKANGKVKKFDVNLRFNGRKLKSHGKTIWYINQGKHTVSQETILLLFNDSVFMLLEKDGKFYVPQIGDLNLPFIYLKHVLVKPNAVDKKSIFIINTEKSTAEMYRLMFETCEEAIRWQGDITKMAENIPKPRGVTEIPFFEQNKEKERKISKKTSHSFSLKSSDQAKSKCKAVSFDMVNECDQKINALLLEREKLIFQLEERNKQISIDSSPELMQREELLQSLQSALRTSTEFLQSRLPPEDKPPVSNLRKFSSPDCKPPKPKRKGTNQDLTVSSRSNWYLTHAPSDCSLSSEGANMPSLDSAFHLSHLSDTQNTDEDISSTAVQLFNTVSNLTRIIIEQDTLLNSNNIPLSTDLSGGLVRHNSTKTKFNKATQNYLQRLGVSTDKKMKGLERRHTLHDNVLSQEQQQQPN